MSKSRRQDIMNRARKASEIFANSCEAGQNDAQLRERGGRDEPV